MRSGTEPPGWIGPVIAFLEANLPAMGRNGEWDHMFSSPFQMACMALCALGQADETPVGAVRRANPAFPERLPRWDDICIAVLGLAVQNRLIDYHSRDGVAPPAPESDIASSPGIGPDRAGGGPSSEREARGLVAGGRWTLVAENINRRKAPPSGVPNIASGRGTGPAWAADSLVPVLEALGLVAGGAWTAVAETVLWREDMLTGEIDFAADARFLAAVDTAVATAPADIRAELAGLSRIGEADVSGHQARIAQAAAEMGARLGERASQQPVPDGAAARHAVEFHRRDDLDWLFFRHWRLSDGWLDPALGPVALEIFNDPLAIAMRRAVMRRLHPEAPFAAL